MPLPDHCFSKLVALIKREALTIALSLFFSIFCFHVFTAWDFHIKIIAIFLCIPLIFLLHLNTDIIIGLSVILLFARIGVSGHYLATLHSIPLLYSYFITYRVSTEKSQFSIPITLPFLIYCISIIPSFFNVSNVLLAFGHTFNLAAFCLYVFVIGRYIDDYKQIKKIIVVFILCSIINGIDIFRKGIMLNDRDFGFAGVVYVDYVCVAMVILLVISLYKKHSKPWIYLALAAFLFLTLLLTQTRNTIISLIMTFLFGLFFLTKQSKLFGLQVKNVIRNSFIIFGILLCLITTILFVAPDFLGRFSELVSKKEIAVTDEEDFGQSSMVTRLLIWHTCLNAFIKHPIIGIGAYSFPFESERYYTIPTMLYSLFVKGLSPHVTYIAVITETGIIGMIGFLIFLISSLLMGYRNIANSKNDLQRFYSFGVFLLQLYVALSMLMTDAWIRGHCAILWGIILGVSIANHNIINKYDLK